MIEFLLKHPEAHFEATAILFDLILIFFSNVQVKRNTKVAKIYQHILYCGFLLTVLETSTSWLEDLPGTIFAFYAINICNTFVYIFVGLIAFYFSRYIEATYEVVLSKKILYFSNTVIIIYTLIVLSNLFNGIISLYDYSQHKYIHGDFFIIIAYGVPIIYFLFDVIICIKNFKNTSYRLRYPVVSIIVIIISAFLIQPWLTYIVNVNGLFISVAIFLLYLTVETRDFHELSLATEKLKRTRAKTDKANEEKTMFLANMSHEIRTPLNGLLGLNEMIIRESKDLSTIEYAKNLKNAGSTLLSIIDNVLDIPKIETDEIIIEKKPYDLFKTINDVKIIISSRAQSKNISFFVEISKNLPQYLVGDETRIRQIIINILNNSVKYTREGQITFKISGQIVNDNINVEMEFCDTGVGIKNEDIEYLFDMYKRVNSNENKSIEGTGIGLAIVKQNLDKMDGTIEVHSQYGKGSCFKVNIPQKIYKRILNDKIQDKGHDNNIVKTAPNAKVLVVDDNEMNLMVAKGFLRKTQVQVTTADGGQTAIELLSKNKYDLIFLDAFMPVVDGISVLKEIKKNDRHLNYTTPTIVLTADALSGSREKYLSEGFDEYLSKPLDPEKLCNTLFKYIEKEE